MSYIRLSFFIEILPAISQRFVMLDFFLVANLNCLLMAINAYGSALLTFFTPSKSESRNNKSEYQYSFHDLNFNQRYKNFFR